MYGHKISEQTGEEAVEKHRDPVCGMAVSGANDETNGRAYTCPMHPEVRQEAPGDCPKCGMAL